MTQEQLDAMIAAQKAIGATVRLHQAAVTSKRPNVVTLLVKFPDCEDEAPIMVEGEGHTFLVIQPDPEDEYTMLDVERLWRNAKAV